MNDQQNVIDYLRRYHPSTPSTYKIATSLLSGLTRSSLLELASVVESRFILYRIRKMLKAPSEPQRNAPVARLLALYTDKRSGRVVSSREELFRRFPYLDSPQQTRVADAFLSGSLSDVEKMSGYLMGHWDDKYQGSVEKAWLSMPGNDSLAKLVIRYFPLDYVMEHMSQLEAFDGPMLATRRCQAGEQPEIGKWPLTDYLAIIHNSGMSMSEDDAIFLMKSYLVSSAAYDSEQGRVPNYTLRSDIRHPSLIYLEGVRLMLYYLGGMGLTKALGLFETMDSETCNEMNDGGYIDGIAADGQVPFEEKVSRIWQTFCSTFVERYDSPELMKMEVRKNTDATPCISYGKEYEQNYAPGPHDDSESSFGDFGNGNGEDGDGDGDGDGIRPF